MSALTIYTSKKEKESLFAKTSEGKLDIVAICIPIALGVMSAINHRLNLYLSGVMPSAVFFPIVNGGGLVLTTLSAVLLFKERLGKRQWLGVALGVLSVLCLCIG